MVALAMVGVADLAPARAAALTVTVRNRPVTAPLADDFLGLALEFDTVPRWEGGHGQAPDSTFDALLHNLSPIGRPLIRIGGQSTDRSWWPIPGVKRPLGVTHDLGPSWARAARGLAVRTGARLMLGINLEADDIALSRYEADRFAQRIGESRIAAFEIGNEPELYLKTPWYKVFGGIDLPWYATSGTTRYARPPTFGPVGFDNEYAEVAAVSPDAVGLAGPEVGLGPWMSAFTGRFVRHGSRVQMLTSHAYGLNNCVRDSQSPKYPTVPNLLSLTASRDLLTGIGGYVALAHREGLSYRIDEMGSVTCNGRPGVSDTLASALWALDALFAVAHGHVDGVNLHSYPESANGLFDLRYRPGAHAWQATVHPLYYGALMFAQSAPAGSRLLSTTGGSLPGLRAWSTRGADGRLRVVLINDSITSSELVDVRVPPAFRAHRATVERLTGPSPDAESGVELGGRSFGATETGLLPAPELGVSRPGGGHYAVSLPPSSAALVTLLPRSQTA